VAAPFHSVCLASYNGEKYIKNQLLSILQQLGENDEIVIVDDKSNDLTIDVIKGLKDNRIKLFINKKNKGPSAAYERAIYLSKGDIIFLSDQDDIWINGRIKMMMNVLEIENTSLVSSNFNCLDSNGNRIEKYENALEYGRSAAHFEIL
jgi:glycosyltransferase involved in cell wall biosynthesis